MSDRILLDGRVILKQGDVRALLKTLDDESVHCCITSPPYFGLRSYLPEGHADKGLELGSERTLEEHIANMVNVFREVRRVLRKDGTCWINYGDVYASSVNGRSAADTKALGQDDRTFRDKPYSTVGGIFKPKDLMLAPQRLAIALHADGWFLRSQIPWIKRNCLPESINDRPATAIEYVFLLAKSARYFYDAEAVKRAASNSTHARLAQDVASQAGSLRANGGRKTNGPMKAVIGRPKLAAAGSGIRANESYESVMSGEVLPARNFRNTDLFFDSLETPWGLVSGGDGRPLALDVPAAAYRDAHTATFPVGLVDPLIRAGTSEKGVCVTCGAPWRRIVEAGEADLEHQRACGGDVAGAYDGVSTKNYAAARVQDASATKARILEGMKERITVGWEPTCKCAAHDPVPAILLDIFCGSGTLPMVAARLGRRAIGLELNAADVEMAANRINEDWMGEEERKRSRAKRGDPVAAGPLFA